jgi:hypothetical protein
LHPRDVKSALGKVKAVHFVTNDESNEKQQPKQNHAVFDLAGNPLGFNTLERKVQGSVVFEHYTQRPEFRVASQKTGAHENRFTIGNFNTL